MTVNRGVLVGILFGSVITAFVGGAMVGYSTRGEVVSPGRTLVELEQERAAYSTLSFFCDREGASSNAKHWLAESERIQQLIDQRTKEVGDTK